MRVTKINGIPVTAFGFQGVAGTQGPQGLTGADSTVAGPQGPQGYQGPEQLVAGSSGDIQYNEGDELGADSDFNWDSIEKKLKINKSSIQSDTLNRKFIVKNKILTVGAAGYALNFTTGYGDLGSNFFVVTENTPHSYSAWVYITVAGQNYWVFNNGGNVGGSSLVIWGGALGMFYNGGNAVVTSNSKVPTNQWALIELSYDGAGYVTFYINGVSDGTKPVVGGWSTPIGSNCKIGQWYSSGAYQFAGKIDELRVYDREITAQEALDHYNSGVGQYGQPETGLVAGWHFDEGSGTTIEDYSGNNHDGTLMYGVSYVEGLISPEATENDVEVFGHENSNTPNKKGIAWAAPESTMDFGIGTKTPILGCDIDKQLRINKSFLSKPAIFEINTTLNKDEHYIVYAKEEITITLPSLQSNDMNTYDGLTFNIINVADEPRQITIEVENGDYRISDDTQIILTSKWDSIVIQWSNSIQQYIRIS